MENNQKTEIENVLKNEHGRRETEIINVHRATRNAEDFIRRVEREEKRYYTVTEAIKEYFKTIEELNQK